jgi:hypothetical protein
MAYFYLQYKNFSVTNVKSNKSREKVYRHTNAYGGKECFHLFQ